MHPCSGGQEADRRRAARTRPDVRRWIRVDLRSCGRALVAIDGVDGSGKTTFTSNLAHSIVGRSVVVVHVDNFLNPAATRHARGRWSPQGHWLDLYDYESFYSVALNPLRRGGDGWYRPASYDAQTDAALLTEAVHAPDDAIVLVEGLFLHRAELVDVWDLSIFLDVPVEEMVRRLSERDGTNPDAEHETTQRYVGGQRIYFEEVSPWCRATFVVDNADVENPYIVDPATRDAMTLAWEGATRA